jgi:hypothetical protein
MVEVLTCFSFVLGNRGGGFQLQSQIIFFLILHIKGIRVTPRIVRN